MLIAGTLYLDWIYVVIYVVISVLEQGLDGSPVVKDSTCISKFVGLDPSWCPTVSSSVLSLVPLQKAWYQFSPKRKSFVSLPR